VTPHATAVDTPEKIETQSAREEREKDIETPLMDVSAKYRNIMQGQEASWGNHDDNFAQDMTTSRTERMVARHFVEKVLLTMKMGRGIYWKDFCPVDCLTASTHFMNPLIFLQRSWGEKQV
jgi:hypothetical protein